MWKIVVVLLLTALAILLARLAYDAPVIQTRVGALVSQMQGGVSAPPAPAFMYAGVRG
jgi:hypothetical protein